MNMKRYAYIPLSAFMVVFVVFVTILIAVDVPMSLVHNVFHSYSTNTELAIAKNKARVVKALDYIYSFSTPMIQAPTDILQFEIDLLVVIVTVARNRGSDNPGYLLQTAAGMDKLLKQDSLFPRKFMFICNVDRYPEENVDAIKLKDYLPYVQKNGTNNMKLPTIPVTPMRNSGLEEYSRKKEISDYAFCLQVSKQFNFKYVLVLEDDVIPYVNMFQVLHHVITYHVPMGSINEDHHGNHVRNFTFLKLYYPTTWQGFAWEVVPLLDLFSFGMVGSVLFVLAFSIPWENKRSTKRKYNPALMWTTFLCGLLVSICIAQILGRQYLMDFRRVSPQLFRFSKSSACCTQAMLYKKETLQEICDHILINNSLNKDLAIYDLAQKSGVPGFQIEPNLFQHVGMWTSLSSQIKEPDAYIFDTNLFD